MRKVIIGSRGSDLALWQAHYIQDRLAEMDVESTIQIIKTQGDRIQHLSFDKMEGKGFFTKEIEAALLEKRIDVAVHSHKDLETTEPEGLTISAVSYREDPRDILLIHKHAYKKGSSPICVKQDAVVGTSSARRKAQLKHFRPDVQIKDIRGNVPTRIEKLRSGDFDAIVLAAAGLTRLNLDVSDLHCEFLSPHEFVPAPAQGVLAFQTRSDDKEVIDIIQKLHRSDVANCIGQERGVLRLLDGGCQLPFGMYVTRNDDTYQTWVAMQGDDKLKRLYTESKEAPNPEKVLGQLKSTKKERVFISRDLSDAQRFVDRLEGDFEIHGASQIAIRHNQRFSAPQMEDEWIFISSKNGVKHLDKEDITDLSKVAVVGPGTGEAFEERFNQSAGFVGDAEENTVDTLKQFAETHRPTKVVFAVGTSAADTLAKTAEDLGVGTRREEVYAVSAHPVEVPECDIYVFTSALNATVFLQHHKLSAETRNIAIGDSTAAFLAQQGFTQVTKAWSHSEEALADSVFGVRAS